MSPPSQTFNDLQSGSALSPPRPQPAMRRGEGRTGGADPPCPGHRLVCQRARPSGRTRAGAGPTRGMAVRPPLSKLPGSDDRHTG